MASLPISNNSQTPGNITTALQASSIADGSAVDIQSAESFALLLAQQISDACLSALNTGQAAITTVVDTTDGGAGLPLQDVQDQATTLPNTLENQPNILASILQQLPVPEDLRQKTEGKQAIPQLAVESLQKAGHTQALQPLARDVAQQADGSLETQSLVDGFSQKVVREQQAAIPEDSQSIQLTAVGQNPLKAAKSVDLPVGMTQQIQNTVQPIASSSIPVAAPSTPSNGIAPNNNQPSITTPVGGNGWAEEFSQKISWVSTQQNQIAALHLNPPNLGPLDVVLKISDNQATALFTSPHGAVRDAVENALPKLREILADNGIMLGNTTISDQPPRERSMDEFANQGFGTTSQQPNTDIVSEQDGALSGVAQTTPVRRHNGMVDTFA